MTVQGDPKTSPTLMAIPAFFAYVYSHTWFASFGVAFGVYVLLMSLRGARMK